MKSWIFAALFIPGIFDTVSAREVSERYTSNALAITSSQTAPADVYPTAAPSTSQFVQSIRQSINELPEDSMGDSYTTAYNSDVEVTDRSPASKTKPTGFVRHGRPNRCVLPDRDLGCEDIVRSDAVVIPKTLPDQSPCDGPGCDNIAMCLHHTVFPKPGFKFYVPGSGSWFDDWGRGLLDNIRGECRGTATFDWGFDYHSGGAVNAGLATTKVLALNPRVGQACIQAAIWRASRSSGAIEGVECTSLENMGQLPTPPVAEPSDNMITDMRFTRHVSFKQGTTSAWTFYAWGEWFTDGGKGFMDNLQGVTYIGDYRIEKLDDGWWWVQIEDRTGFLGAFNMNLAVFLASGSTGALRATFENPAEWKLPEVQERKTSIAAEVMKTLGMEVGQEVLKGVLGALTGAMRR